MPLPALALLACVPAATTAPRLPGPQSDVPFTPPVATATTPYGSSFNVTQTGGAQLGALAVDAQGVPTLAWIETSSGSPQVRVRQYTGAGWVGIAGSDVGSGIGQAGAVQRLAVDVGADDSAPCVTWSVGGAPGGVALRCLRAGAWVDWQSGGAVPGLDDAATGTIEDVAVVAGAQPLVLWSGQAPEVSDGFNAWRVYARQLGGDGVFAASNAVAAANVELHGVAVAARNGAVRFASIGIAPAGDRSDAAVYVFAQAAGQGSALPSPTPPDPNNSSQPAHTPSIALGSDGQPVVAWVQGGANPGDAGTFVAAARYDGRAWQPLPRPTCSDSACNQAAFAPLLAVDTSGRVVLAWGDGAPQSALVAVRRLAAGAWGEVTQAGVPAGPQALRGAVTPLGLAIDPPSQQPVLAFMSGQDIYVARLQ